MAYQTEAEDPRFSPSGPLLGHVESTSGEHEFTARAMKRAFTDRYGHEAQPPTWGGSESSLLQTHCKPLDSSEQSILARKHTYKHQLFHLLEKVMVRLFNSIVLSGAMIGTFKYFEKVKVLNNLEKNVFNVMSTMIYLTMGLNLAGAFKGMATMLRWKLLARKSHNLIEVDLILGIPSLIKVFKLGMNALGFGKPMVFVACILWIVVNCVARMSVAFTGLTYAYDSAGGTGTELGVVLISDKKTFWPLGIIQETKVEAGAEFQTAHFFGEYSAMMADNRQGKVPKEDQILQWDEQRKLWNYTFREYNPDYIHLVAETNRTISVTANCVAYPIIKGQNGKLENITFFNSTANEVREIRDVVVRGPGATVWANPRSDVQPEPDWVCALGPRCAMIAGFQFIDEGIGETGNGTLFQCAVNVGTVRNSRIRDHEVNDRVAFIAAGAIGLDGFSDDPQNWLYQRYYRGTTFGTRVNGDKGEMAMLVSRFSAGVIATMDIDNPKIRAVGMKPWSGVLFKVYWWMLFTILGSICAVQLILGLAAVFISNTVIVKDDSELATARLLRPLVERLGPSGCALTGKEIAKTLRTSMVYGVRIDKTGQRHHLDFGEDIVPLKRFPDGWYDGEVEGMEEKQRLLAPVEEAEEEELGGDLLV